MAVTIEVICDGVCDPELSIPVTSCPIFTVPGAIGLTRMTREWVLVGGSKVMPPEGCVPVNSALEAEYVCTAMPARETLCPLRSSTELPFAAPLLGIDMPLPMYNVVVAGRALALPNCRFPPIKYVEPVHVLAVVGVRVAFLAVVGRLYWSLPPKATVPPALPEASETLAVRLR